MKLSPSCKNEGDSYSTTFLPVVSDARVALPLHYKHFSFQMFTFIRDKEVVKDQVRTTANAPVCRTVACLHSKLCPDLCPL